MKTLRNDQLQLESDIYSGWNSGSKNMLAVLPTGGGKSVVMSKIVHDRNNVGSKQIVMAHRNELVSQMSLHVASWGVNHQLIAPKPIVQQVISEHRKEFNGKSFVVPNAICAVGGVDTINSRAEKLKAWAYQINNWYVDEAHHLLIANKWGKAVAMFPNAYGLGVTATPQRPDGNGLGIHNDGVFYNLAIGPSMRQLIDIGALSDYEIVVPKTDFVIDENNITQSGDFSRKTMAEASQKSHIVGDVVQNYVQHAFGKRAIVFATDVETSKDMANRFNDVGIISASIDAKTPGDIRNEYIRRFRTGKITVLVNVDLFGEGFDVPAVECVIMARPTASLVIYLQQFGRALRTMPGKQFGLIIDMVSNWKRHGYPDKPRVWDLERREKKTRKEKDPEDVELVLCKNERCLKPYEKFMTFCPHCGHVPEITPQSRSSPEFVDGDLILLDRQTLAQLRDAANLSSPQMVAERVALAAGEKAGVRAHKNQEERIREQQALSDAIAQWAGVQRWKGREDRESHKRFYYAAGMTVLEALAMPKSDMEKMREKVEQWINL